MLDIHSHLLFGLDDGAQTLEDSLEMARAAVKEGITHMIVTPHYKKQYPNDAGKIRDYTQIVQEMLQINKIPLKLFPGQEVRIEEGLLDRIREGRIQFLDDGGRYLLLEFPTMVIPEYTQKVIYDLRNNGITPVIAHPERNAPIIKDISILEDLVGNGALAQLTAASLTGEFGSDLVDLSHRLIQKQLVHVIASDAHDLQKRPFKMKEAFQIVEKQYGKELADWYQAAAKSICNGESLKDRPIVQKKKKFGLF